MSRSPICKTCFRVLVGLLAFSLLNASCATGNRKFSLWHFDRDDSLNRELANKAVEVYLQNDAQVSGYFEFMDKDSLFIAPQKNSTSRIAIAISREEIQSIGSKENKHYEIIVIIILAAVMIWVATIGFGDAIDGAGH